MCCEIFPAHHVSCLKIKNNWTLLTPSMSCLLKNTHNFTTHVMLYKAALKRYLTVYAGSTWMILEETQVLYWRSCHRPALHKYNTKPNAYKYSELLHHAGLSVSTSTKFSHSEDGWGIFLHNGTYPTHCSIQKTTLSKAHHENSYHWTQCR